ncbi:MAG: hypothetical protein ACM31C_02960 [Acidobacteriota bacterium]
MTEPRVVGEVSADVLLRIALASQLRSLEDVLAWARATAATLEDVIVQDEFTHDVLVRGPAPAYLCFDTT